MINHSRHGVIEEVAIMIRTGASERAVTEYIDKLLKTDQITTRVYDVLLDMILNSYE